MKKELLAALTAIILLAGCSILDEKPRIQGIERFTLQATESAPYVLQIVNPEGKVKQNEFSNFNIELAKNDLVRLNMVNVSPNTITDGQKATAIMHLTGLELGSADLSFILYYDENEKTKSTSFRIPAKVVGPGVSVGIEEKPLFGKTRMKVGETRIFHAVVTNSKDIRYPNGRLRIIPAYDWIKVKEMQGYESYTEGNELIIATDIPTSKTIPFMVNANPPAIEAGFSLDVVVEYSADTSDWAELSRKTVEMFAED